MPSPFSGDCQTDTALGDKCARRSGSRNFMRATAGNHGLTLESEKTDGERVYRIVMGGPTKAKSKAKAQDPDRQAA